MSSRGRGRRAPSQGGGRHTPSRHEIERIVPSTANSESSASKPQVDSSRLVTESENETRVNSRARGITCGIGARKAMRTAKDRLRVEFNFEIRQAICNNAESFNNEIGFIVRNNCSLQYKEWRLVPQNVRRPLREKLLSLVETSSLVREEIDPIFVPQDMIFIEELNLNDHGLVDVDESSDDGRLFIDDESIFESEIDENSSDLDRDNEDDDFDST